MMLREGYVRSAPVSDQRCAPEGKAATHASICKLAASSPLRATIAARAILNRLVTNGAEHSVAIGCRRSLQKPRVTPIRHDPISTC